MLKVMRSAFSLASIPLPGRCRLTALAAAKLVALLIVAFAASPVLAVWTAEEFHRFSHVEKFLVVGKPGVAPTWNELEPIAVNRNRAAPASPWRHFGDILTLTTPEARVSY